VNDPNLVKLAEVMTRNMVSAFRDRGLVACKLGEGGALTPAAEEFEETCRRFSAAWLASFAKSMSGFTVKKA
jgi:hypothetical protein